MTKKKYDKLQVEPCTLRSEFHHIDEIGQKEWTTTDCLFTGNRCCEMGFIRNRGIKCPLREVIDLN